jgi:hypothetical protein
MIDWENFLNVGLNDYGFTLEGYFGDVYIPWRTLILAGLLLAGFKIKSWLKTRKGM